MWLLCRDPERGEEARAAIARETDEDRVHLRIVDMASLASVRQLVLDVDPAHFDGTRAYANAKRAQAVLAHELAARCGRGR